MRLYNQSDLIALKNADGGVAELKRKLSIVEGSIDLTPEEKRLNKEMIEFAITGQKYTSKQVLDDIKAGEADISDIGGMN